MKTAFVRHDFGTASDLPWHRGAARDLQSIIQLNIGSTLARRIDPLRPVRCLGSRSVFEILPDYPFYEFFFVSIKFLLVLTRKFIHETIPSVCVWLKKRWTGLVEPRWSSPMRLRRER
jgi:hypothetical protein